MRKLKVGDRVWLCHRLHKGYWRVKSIRHDNFVLIERQDPSGDKITAWVHSSNIIDIWEEQGGAR